MVSVQSINPKDLICLKQKISLQKVYENNQKENNTINGNHKRCEFNVVRSNFTYIHGKTPLSFYQLRTIFLEIPQAFSQAIIGLQLKEMLLILKKSYTREETGLHKIKLD